MTEINIFELGDFIEAFPDHTDELDHQRFVNLAYEGQSNWTNTLPLKLAVVQDDNGFVEFVLPWRK